MSENPGEVEEDRSSDYRLSSKLIAKNSDNIEQQGDSR